MLEQAHGLTDAALEAIADLERRVLATDGGRLKLEWATLRTPPTDDVRALLWWEHDRLLGFLGIYGFGWPTLELTGMVDPQQRRRGIGRSLLEAALPLCRARGCERLLLVVPRVSLPGRELATSFGATHDHSEHALMLSKRPADRRRRSGAAPARGDHRPTSPPCRRCSSTASASARLDGTGALTDQQSTHADDRSRRRDDRHAAGHQ